VCWHCRHREQAGARAEELVKDLNAAVFPDQELKVVGWKTESGL